MIPPLRTKRGENASQVMKQGRCANCGTKTLLCPVSKFCLTCDFLATNAHAAFHRRQQDTEATQNPPKPQQNTLF